MTDSTTPTKSQNQKYLNEIFVPDKDLLSMVFNYLAQFHALDETRYPTRRLRGRYQNHVVDLCIHFQDLYLATDDHSTLRSILAADLAQINTAHPQAHRNCPERGCDLDDLFNAAQYRAIRIIDILDSYVHVSQSSSPSSGKPTAEEREAKEKFSNRAVDGYRHITTTLTKMTRRIFYAIYRPQDGCRVSIRRFAGVTDSTGFCAAMTGGERRWRVFFMYVLHKVVGEDEGKKNGEEERWKVWRDLTAGLGFEEVVAHVVKGEVVCEVGAGERCGVCGFVG